MIDKVQKIRKEVEKLHGNPYYMMAVKDVLEILDIQEEPVKDRFAFKAIPRLLDMIEPSDRAKAYIAKLADTLEVEGYSTDAKIVMESLKIMNGEKVPMATMDEEPVSENLFEASAEYAATGEILANGKEMIDFQKQKSFIAGAEWKKAKLPKWKNKPLGGGGCWSGEIFVDPIRRLYRYEHYIINADKLFKLLDKED